MDWNPKTPLLWDWETQALFSGKDCEISEPSDEPVWKFEGDVDVGNGSAFSSGGGTCSGSESGNGLPKSSVSASIDCSTKAELKASDFKSVSSDTVPGNINRILSDVENTSVRVSAEDPKEPIIGLKLGKRTYFEDSSDGHNMKKSSTMTSVPTSPSSAKKPKASQQKLQVYCQVEGCNTDLSKSKEYHRKHRVCAVHSKSPKVIISGQERRFCQQCSRFHGLSEFDQKKRSCRLRLSDHNARRRKPQPETISFNSSQFAPYYDDKHQMNLAFGRTRFGHVNTATSATWDFSGGFKLWQFKDSKSESISAEHQFLPTALPSNSSSVIRAFNGRFPFKSTTPEVFSQGLESPLKASSFEGEQDTQRALSLLSTKSFGSGNFGSASTVQFRDVNYNSSSTHPSMHTTDIPSSFWQGQQHQGKERSFNLHDDSFQFQDFQLHKPGHEDSFFYSR